ncbi:MAG: AIR synthase-related protein, partial [Brachybacterium sp.]|uniref:AIR synthase-related protein n=1 Tax=Brachybacterium sp. TaxID=1891286 RepID=UPI00264728D0
WGSVPQLDLEGTLNMGIGMVALVGADQADATLAVLSEQGLGARVIGEVVAEDQLPEPGTPLEHVIAGAKGVDGGAVLLAGQHPGWT